ncbi:ABC transporter substrate-binding protein [Roseomonas sp. OT10]|uniref:ABC transporter substrate-binding protein n=1 Tax=Roseomonas cutis TaxID=2897332 RepID=UPI001E5E10FD|nr:ABC transporter substrate-binding protein [Roseomonas sp. OT10]UFN51121.1 ABC transporter substrate-binding protein [Roseomonas sp. OT10]
MRYRIERRALLSGAAGLALVPVGASRPRAQALDKVSFQTNWRAQAEHGGYYHAVANGLYRKHGIECDLRMGGPQQNPAQLLLAGRVDMIMSNGFQALSYAREGIPFLCIGAIMQKDPQILMAHPGVGNDSFPAMKGKPILIGASGRVTYWPFLRAKFGFTDEQIRPYTFSVAPFLADKNTIMQGFVSSEPFLAIEQGVQPVVHLIADAGYENYNTTIDISRKMATEKKELVQRFVDASIEGWAEYLAGRNVDAANAMIRRDNPEMTDAKIAYAVKVMNERGIVQSGDALTAGIGAMTAARWKSFYETMRDVGVIPAGVDVEKAYSLDFVNKKVGLG